MLKFPHKSTPRCLFRLLWACSYLKRLSYFVHKVHINAQTFYVSLCSCRVSAWADTEIRLALDQYESAVKSCGAFNLQLSGQVSDRHPRPPVFPSS